MYLKEVWHDWLLFWNMFLFDAFKMFFFAQITLFLELKEIMAHIFVGLKEPKAHNYVGLKELLAYIYVELKDEQVSNSQNQVASVKHEDPTEPEEVENNIKCQLQMKL